MELIDTGLTLKEREHMRMLLEDGEEVLWMARPLIPWWSSAILPVGIFGLVWCGMLTKMCSCGADWGMLPFALVGVALLVAPFLIYRYHKHSAYVLTNKYAHILRPGLTGKVSSTSYPAGSNMVVKTEANLNDTGSLIFGYNTVSTKHGTKQQPYGFLLTRKLAEAERIIATLPPMPQAAEEKEPETSRKTLIVFASLFMLVGSVALHFASAKLMEANDLSKHGLRAQATVCKMIIERNSDNDAFYYPVFQFTTPDGTTHTVKGNHGSNPPAWKKGETASIIYPAGEPEKAVSATFGGLWAAGVLLSVFGLIFTGVSAITLFALGKQKAKKS
ncbi:MAG: DUF3592 domain-containing protein [Akkermansia sp.]|nr:DUF3592 domain-containing protein [Akkermansia sp.]